MSHVASLFDSMNREWGITVIKSFGLQANSLMEVHIKRSIGQACALKWNSCVWRGRVRHSFPTVGGILLRIPKSIFGAIILQRQPSTSSYFFLMKSSVGYLYTEGDIVNIQISLLNECQIGGGNINIYRRKIVIRYALESVQTNRNLVWLWLRWGKKSPVLDSFSIHHT